MHNDTWISCWERNICNMPCLYIICMLVLVFGIKMCFFYVPGSPRVSPRQSPYLGSPRLTHQQNGVVDVPSPKLAMKKQQHTRTTKLLDELKLSLESTEDRSTIFRQLPHESQVFLQQWVPPTNGRPPGHTTNGNSWHNGVGTSSSVCGGVTVCPHSQCGRGWQSYPALINVRVPCVVI